MSTLVQLLATYYKAVVENERIFYENVNIYASPSTDTNSSGSDSSSRIVEEMFLLQRQISQLTTEIQSLRKENDNLKSLQATHKALMESKLNNSKKIIEKLKKEHCGNQAVRSENSSNTPPPVKPHKKQTAFHLLSPLNARNLEDRTTPNHSSEAKSQPTRLRSVLNGGHQTLFDGDQTFDNPSADRTEEVIFVNSLKHKDELANIVLPSDGLSDNDETNIRGRRKNQQLAPGIGVSKRKRKLARKRIQTANSDNDD